MSTNTTQEPDYEALRADPEYRASVEAAGKAGLRIELRAPGRTHWNSLRATRFDAWEIMQYRIAPGQEWPLPQKPVQENSEHDVNVVHDKSEPHAVAPVAPAARKAREFWIMRRTDADTIGTIVEAQNRPAGIVWYHCGIKVREVLDDDADRLAAEEAQKELERLRVALVTTNAELEVKRAELELVMRDRERLRAEAYNAIVSAAQKVTNANEMAAELDRTKGCLESATKACDYFKGRISIFEDNECKARELALRTEQEFNTVCENLKIDLAKAEAARDAFADVLIAAWTKPVGVTITGSFEPKDTGEAP